MNISELQNKKLSDLKETARKMGLTGWTALRKQDLIYLIIENLARTSTGAGNGVQTGVPKVDPSTFSTTPKQPSGSPSKSTSHARPPRKSKVAAKSRQELPRTQKLNPSEPASTIHPSPPREPSGRSPSGSDQHTNRRSSSYGRRPRRDRHARKDDRRRRGRESRQDFPPKQPDLRHIDVNTILPKTGLLDITNDGYGFLRSPEHSYMPGPNDVYMSQSQIKRFGLRPGDTIEGDARPPKESERYFALLHVKRINGQEPVPAMNEKSLST